jgi:hypothetical protein
VPVNLLNKVDLPTFGRPAITTDGSAGALFTSSIKFLFAMIPMPDEIASNCVRRQN